MVLTVVALIFQRLERLIFHLPPRPSPSHEAKDMAYAYPQVGHPTAVLDLVLAYLPVLDDIDPHIDIRSMERHIMDKPQAMDNPGSAVVSLIRGHASGVLRPLHLPEQKGMIAFFDSKDRVQSVVVQGLDVRSIGTQAVFGADALEVGVVLAEA